MSEAKPQDPIETFRRERSRLRFSRLSRDQARRLRSLFWEVDEFWDVQVRPRADSTEEFIATVDLRADVDYGWLKGFVEEGGFGEDEYGVAVSITTDNPTPVVRVPRFVADLGKEIGGFVDFSYTVI